MNQNRDFLICHLSISICVFPQGCEVQIIPDSKQIPHTRSPKHNAATTITIQCIKSVDPLVVQILAAKILPFIEL